MSAATGSLRQHALRVLLCADAQAKAELARLD